VGVAAFCDGFFGVAAFSTSTFTGSQLMSTDNSVKIEIF
jgi:hypothetical protein